MKINLKDAPFPAQIPFFTSRAAHTCYGGSRGPGKSWAMRRKFVFLALKYRNLNLLLLRRTLPELRENHVVHLLKDTHGFAKYNSTERVLTFATGSRIIMGYCKSEADVLQYQGQEYDVVGMEEATHFTKWQWEQLTLMNRNTRTDFKPRMYYTCNPGGVGHAWVKELFIDKNYRNGEQPEDYCFIKARVYDNPAIMQNNPDYIRRLEALPEDLRRAYLDGDWDVFTGQYFREFRREVHTVEPFPIPAHWRRYRAIDYGLDMLACLWGAADDMGNLYIYRELCKKDLIVSEACKAIFASEAPSETPFCTYAPKDIWQRSRATGQTMAQMFAEGGLPLTPVANSRVDGWLNIKEWLRPRPDGMGGEAPRLRIFNTCRELIANIPLLQHDDKDPNDVATEPHDITHAPDALRYMLDGRPGPTIIMLPTEGGRPMEDQISDFMHYGG